MKINTTELVHLSENELKSLGQIGFALNDEYVGAKVARMLCHIRNDEPPERVLSDLRKNIARIKHAQTLLPLYERIVNEIENRVK